MLWKPVASSRVPGVQVDFFLHQVSPLQSSLNEFAYWLSGETLATLSVRQAFNSIPSVYQLAAVLRKIIEHPLH